ncbi:hypothetical protein O181_124608 [Austropuccinia psidii MF-1]|uniref:CCHC-type domain-containing protein n=1 Tax=Austropuccinia psidii MF-1 TaxID=1389203 RepID=A0A9Q3KN96_9BASI|nr:hypothetical protein [Austropuccinia psidii MF-1]
MCPTIDDSNLMIEDSIGDYDGEPIQEDNEEMVHLLKSLNKNVEENNKNNAKTQAITNKLLAAYEKMSHRIDSVLLRMEAIEKKVAYQEKLMMNNNNHNKEKINKTPKDFIKAIIPIKKNINPNQLDTNNRNNTPQDTETHLDKQTKTVGDYSKALQTTPRIPHPLPAIPKFSKVNRFKLAYITLRSKVGHPKPFENLSAHSVQTKINQVLKDVNAKVYEESIFVSAVVKFTNGTIKLCAKNKASVRWLLENKHKWTHLADPSFITSPNLYHVIIHSCPAFFDISDESDISELCEQNDIDRKEIKKVRWLKTPNIEEKNFGSLVISLENRNLAYDIIKGGDLLFKGNLLRAARYQPGPPQCYNCLHVGHLALACKNKPVCIKCGEEHILREYLKYHHSAYSSYCPIKKAELDSFKNTPSQSSQ